MTGPRKGTAAARARTRSWDAAEYPEHPSDAKDWEA